MWVIKARICLAACLCQGIGMREKRGEQRVGRSALSATAYCGSRTTYTNKRAKHCLCSNQICSFIRTHSSNIKIYCNQLISINVP